jgi:hypothetical protein
MDMGFQSVNNQMDQNRTKWGTKTKKYKIYLYNPIKYKVCKLIYTKK